ncbi:hypothetical protein HY768_05880 [candidate division TA06 bacterium]|uniref:Uncharacterized protein n=1 Tax=candidate division TA06 bacterium TaxID=2250710 RepID=A0A933MI45_UNCT6|nr:hypothetical protein [candidate division TA06 bacterium]
MAKKTGLFLFFREPYCSAKTLIMYNNKPQPINIFRRKTLKKLFTLAILLAVGLGLAFFGCSKNPTTSEETAVDDDAAITTVLNTNGYATSDNYGDDGTAGFAKSDAKSDTFPYYVRWRRRINTPVERTISIAYDSNNTFATVTISSDYTGRFVVDNTPNLLLDTFSRAINDHGVRYVWLKKWNDHWYFWGASPLEIATVNPQIIVYIDSVKITGTGGERPNVTFIGSLYGQTLRRDQMPIFEPGATVTATVYTRISSGADSTWAFLHRRIWHSAGWSNHIREPLERVTGEKFVFTKTWTLYSDSILAFPALRHACLDVILGSTLFGDSTAEYSARMWTVPYIVKAVGDTTMP